MVIGNRDHRRTVPVDVAHDGAKAMRGMVRAFGSEERRQGGQLRRNGEPGRSDAWAVRSGRGVSDLGSARPFLLPAGRNPNSPESDVPLAALPRNLAVLNERWTRGGRSSR